MPRVRNGTGARAALTELRGTFAVRLLAAARAGDGPPVKMDLDDGGDAHVTLTTR